MDRELRLHAIFGILFVLSFLGGPHVEALLPGWHDPKLGLISFSIALIWLTTFFMQRGSALLDELKIHKARIEKLENRVRELEDHGPDEGSGGFDGTPRFPRR